MELVWSNALLYNNDPSHLVYVIFLALPFFFAAFVVMCLMRFVIRHQAALRGRDELWRSHAFSNVLSKVTGE
jgi:hypothetical protein